MLAPSQPNRDNMNEVFASALVLVGVAICFAAPPQIFMAFGVSKLDAFAVTEGSIVLLAVYFGTTGSAVTPLILPGGAATLGAVQSAFEVTGLLLDAAKRFEESIEDRHDRRRHARQP